DNNQGFVSTIPWTTALIIKLALEDKEIKLGSGLACTKGVFDICHNDLNHNVEIDEDSKKHIWLLLRSLLYVQMKLQEPKNHGYMRWPALLHRQGCDNECYTQFVNEFGVE